ncbi:secernin-2 [Anopheles bellator]|uniref:secernin-2 n=1 Tax=Anopheles bellator TaxID=139047 RepID=UPI002649D466|nr:secernin-2 [Anopheles bellator]XP_058057942.1 secernin-2 [Anopheles bellator]
MSTNGGETFVVLPPCTESARKQIIFGRNGTGSGDDVSEVVYVPAETGSEPVSLPNGCEIEGATSYAVILNKPAGSWGAESGSNEKAVTIGLSYSEGATEEGKVSALDLVRLGLERSESASGAIDTMVGLVERYGSEDRNALKAAFVICDPAAVWLLNVAGHFWAAKQVQETSIALAANGFTIGSPFDRSTEGLADAAKDAGAWDGSGEFSFSAAFGGSPDDAATRSWPANEPGAEGAFGLKQMFECLRASGSSTGSSQVSVLTGDGELPCHWFTATPLAEESVFKPFIFTAGAKISPLTRVPEGETQTLLHRLHSNRKWEAVGSLLSSLEDTCVDEVNRFLGEHSGEPSQELDELMKDCVEAEVKFYR